MLGDKLRGLSVSDKVVRGKKNLMGFLKITFSKQKTGISKIFEMGLSRQTPYIPGRLSPSFAVLACFPWSSCKTLQMFLSIEMQMRIRP